MQVGRFVDDASWKFVDYSVSLSDLDLEFLFLMCHSSSQLGGIGFRL
jgi:hypothetical protein